MTINLSMYCVEIITLILAANVHTHLIVNCTLGPK